MPNIGETVYYRRESGGFVQKAILIGETSRSWLIGQGGEWWRNDPELVAKCATKLPKKGTAFESNEAYELSMWASEKRWKIREQINFATPEQLKKIAEIIDFKG